MSPPIKLIKGCLSKEDNQPLKQLMIDQIALRKANEIVDRRIIDG